MLLGAKTLLDLLVINLYQIVTCLSVFVFGALQLVAQLVDLLLFDPHHLFVVLNRPLNLFVLVYQLFLVQASISAQHKQTFK